MGAMGMLYTISTWIDIQSSGVLEHDFFNMNKDRAQIMLIWSVIFAVFILVSLWMAKKTYPQFGAMVGFAILMMLFSLHLQFGGELNIKYG